MSDDPRKQPEPLPPAELPKLTRRIVDAACDIAEIDPETPEFLHAVLCQCGLPRSRPESRIFERHNGNASLRLEAGAVNIGHGKWIDYPLPYGTKPRLILYHLCSEAVRKQSPIVDVGGSIREFLKRIGISYGGTEFAQFKGQMTALSVMRMTLAFQDDRRRVQVNTVPVHRFEAWLHPDPHQASFWQDTIQLSAEFFETLAAHAVPLDPRAIGALQHSALALDVYTWLAHRLCRVRKDEGVKLSWANLREQFGQEYKCPKNFKKEFRAALLKARAVYPDARIDDFPGGLILKPSPSPVPKASVVKLPRG